MWYIHKMRHNSALKRKKILTYAVTWMDLEIIMLSEICVQLYHLFEIPRTAKFIEREAEWWLFHGYQVSVWDDEKFWSWIMVMEALQCE